MPDFDGNGPLTRGRIIGRGRGPCRQTSFGCPRKETVPKTRQGDKTSAHEPEYARGEHAKTIHQRQ